MLVAVLVIFLLAWLPNVIAEFIYYTKTYTGETRHFIFLSFRSEILVPIFCYKFVHNFKYHHPLNVGIQKTKSGPKTSNFMVKNRKIHPDWGSENKMHL